MLQGRGEGGDVEKTQGNYIVDSWSGTDRECVSVYLSACTLNLTDSDTLRTTGSYFIEVRILSRCSPDQFKV